MEEEFESAEQGSDRTKWVWIAVAILVVATILGMWQWGGVRTNVSVVRARHILISCNFGDPADRARALELAQQLRQRILDGEDFATLAREYSNEPGADTSGGNLPPAPRGTYEDAFDAYVWTADIDAISEPVRTGYGFHIIQVLERRYSRADRAEKEIEREALDTLRD